jgi:hypothetical protein
MINGFYWGTMLPDIEGERSGVILVKDGIGYLYGFAFIIAGFDFGDNPQPLLPPRWIIDSKIAKGDLK